MVMCGIGLCATAQKKTEWTINVGASVPVGSFSHMQYDKNTGATDCGLFDEDINGGATTGFNIGAKAMFPTKNEHLGITLAMDVHYNGLNSNATCNLDKRPYYLNIPFMVGLNYSYPLPKEMKLFGELGAGFNIRYISPGKLTGVQKYIFANSSEDTWMQVKETFSYETVVTFAFHVGAGLFFTDNLYLSVYYSFLGKGDVDANVEAILSSKHVQPYNANSQYLQLGSVNPSILSFNIGYTF